MTDHETTNPPGPGNPPSSTSPPADALTKWQRAALMALEGEGGFTTGDIGRITGHGSGRTQSAWLHHATLLPLERSGLIAKMDAEKPIVWVLTDAGRRLLKEGGR